MVGWLILIGLILLIAWTVWSESRVRKKAQEVLGDDYPEELKKTSTFGSSFFWIAAGALTSAIIFLVCREFVVAGILALLAFVLWYIGFRHDRPNLEKFYNSYSNQRGEKMRLGFLQCFIYQINAAIDTGKYQDISIAEVKEHIKEGDLLPYLERTLGDDVDLSLFIPVKDLGAPDQIDGKKDKIFWIKSQVQWSGRATKRVEELIESLQRILDVGAGDEKRKWGIENSGLCLLVAWITEIIGWREWEGPIVEIINIYPKLERLVENWAKLSPEIRSNITEMSKLT